MSLSVGNKLLVVYTQYGHYLFHNTVYLTNLFSKNPIILAIPFHRELTLLIFQFIYSYHENLARERKFLKSYTHGLKNPTSLATCEAKKYLIWFLGVKRRWRRKIQGLATNLSYKICTQFSVRSWKFRRVHHFLSSVAAALPSLPNHKNKQRYSHCDMSCSKLFILTSGVPHGVVGTRWILKVSGHHYAKFLFCGKRMTQIILRPFIS